MTGVWLIVGLLVITGIAVFFLKEFVGGFLGLYRIVPLNEAHIRILNNSKSIFSARTGQSAYWYIPFITKVTRLPLTNLTIDVNDIKLNDKDMAKFICDMVCFVNIKDIEKAGERLTSSPATKDMGFDLQRLQTDLRAIVESVMRTVSTKQSILEIYKDRSALDTAISNEVAKVFPSWGLDLVDLELKDLKDAEDSSIIHDIESLKAADLHRDAEIRKAETDREARLKKAEADELAKKREIERDRTVAFEQQKMRMEVAKQEKEANTTTIEAKRVMEFGQADINRQVTEKNAEATRRKLEIEAEGMKQKLTLEAEGEARKVETIGKAQADVVFLSKDAEARGTEKIADAMKKFDEISMKIKMLDIQRDVMIERYRALASSLAKADIKMIMQGDQANDLFGLSLTAGGGAAFDQFLEMLDVENRAKVTGVIETIKKGIPGNDKPGKAA